MFKFPSTAAFAALAFSSIAFAHASEISIQFQGQWSEQTRPYGYNPNGPVVIAAPTDFFATVTFDPASAFYTPANPGGLYVMDNGMSFYMPPMPYSYMTYNMTTVTSSVMNYGVENPYGSNGVNYSSGVRLDMQAFNYGWSDLSAPNQTLRFYTGGYSRETSGNQAFTWSNGLELQSPLWNIDVAAIGKTSEADLLALIYTAFENSEPFSANFSSYTMYQAPNTLQYPTGLGFKGTAYIVSVNSVPEPNSALLLVAGLVVATVIRRRAVH